MIFKRFDWLLLVSVLLICYLKIKPAACKACRVCRRAWTHAYGRRECARGSWSSITGFLTTLPLSHLEEKADSLTHFCKYNRHSTLGKHNQNPSNTFSWLPWSQIPAGMCTKSDILCSPDTKNNRSDTWCIHIFGNTNSGGMHSSCWCCPPLVIRGRLFEQVW